MVTDLSAFHRGIEDFVAFSAAAVADAVLPPLFWLRAMVLVVKNISPLRID